MMVAPPHRTSMSPREPPGIASPAVLVDEKMTRGSVVVVEVLAVVLVVAFVFVSVVVSVSVLVLVSVFVFVFVWSDEPLRSELRRSFDVLVVPVVLIEPDTDGVY